MFFHDRRRVSQNRRDVIDGHPFREQFHGKCMSESVSVPFMNTRNLKKLPKRSLPVRNRRLQQPVSRPEQKSRPEFFDCVVDAIGQRKPHDRPRFTRLLVDAMRIYRVRMKAYHISNTQAAMPKHQNKRP